eukprot:364938-Chlamydomonas_euryale.AAC.37
MPLACSFRFYPHFDVPHAAAMKRRWRWRRACALTRRSMRGVGWLALDAILTPRCLAHMHSGSAACAPNRLHADTLGAGAWALSCMHAFNHLQACLLVKLDSVPASQGIGFMSKNMCLESGNVCVAERDG